MSRDPIIPASPNEEEYAATAEANAVEIFDRDEPFDLFRDWLQDAKGKEPNDANAMALATADASGLPDVRMVLLKDVDTEGFVFYTNLESAKGSQLSENLQAALCFHWKSLRRQVRVRVSLNRWPARRRTPPLPPVPATAGSEPGRPNNRDRWRAVSRWKNRSPARRHVSDWERCRVRIIGPAIASNR